MSAPAVAAGAAFVAGLRSEALGTYRRMYDGQRELLSKVMQLDIPSTRRYEDHFFYKAAPHIVRWAYGENRPQAAFGGVKFQVTNHRWAMSIGWQQDDLADDQTGGLLEQARGVGRSAALLDERVFFQTLTSATDSNLLGTVPTAPDGQALFSATNDGSAARFGVSSGNVVSGATLSTTANVQVDFFKSVAQFKKMQDGEGQPLHDDSVTDGTYTVIYGATNEKVFADSFLQNLNQGTSAGVSNVIRDAGRTPRLWSTQRITDSDWFVFADNSPLKAVFSQSREPLQEDVANDSNSDTSRTSGFDSIGFKMRKGFGVMEPYAAIIVNN